MERHERRARRWRWGLRVCVLACLGVVVLEVASAWFSLLIVRSRSTRLAGWVSVQHHLFVGVGKVALARRPSRIWIGTSVSLSPTNPSPEIQWWQWTWAFGLPGTAGIGTLITFPIWSLAAPFVLAAPWCYVRSRRTPPNHCVCGYDLSGASGARCPECGRDVTRSA